MRLEHLLSGALTLTLPNPQVIPGGKRKKEKQELRKTRKDEGSSDTPFGFLYYGHLFSMYIEIFDMLTHETVE